MFYVVFTALGLSLLIVLAVALFMFMSVAFAEPQPAWAIARGWQPPPRLTGVELRGWATGAAHFFTARRLRSPPTAERVAKLAAEICAGVTFAIDQSPQKSRRQAKAGCPDCRHEMIPVTPPEVLAIAEDIRHTKPKGEVQRIHDLALDNARKTAALTRVTYRAAHVTCPLLAEDESCCAFSERPIPCRGWCPLRLPSEQLAANSSAEQKVALDSHAYNVATGAQRGFSTSLKAAGMDGDLYELNSALVAALDTPHAAERWVDGEKVFQDCKRFE